uniref:Uncharacterized protein n=1 Tax=Timema tahoe TaxID=61484 RepID=A0A7R9FP09_9NEOP|nr:unnamed protein product [Timema tahoe]
MKPTTPDLPPRTLPGLPHVPPRFTLPEHPSFPPRLTLPEHPSIPPRLTLPEHPSVPLRLTLPEHPYVPPRLTLPEHTRRHFPYPRVSDHDVTAVGTSTTSTNITREVVFSHTLLMSFDRMKPRSRDLALLMDLMLTRQINSEILPNCSGALYILISVYQQNQAIVSVGMLWFQDMYQQLVQSLLDSQQDSVIAARLARAFTDLTANIALDTNRMHRNKFRDNFDKFIATVRSFLVINHNHHHPTFPPLRVVWHILFHFCRSRQTSPFAMHLQSAPLASMSSIHLIMNKETRLPKYLSFPLIRAISSAKVSFSPPHCAISSAKVSFSPPHCAISSAEVPLSLLLPHSSPILPYRLDPLPLGSNASFSSTVADSGTTWNKSTGTNNSTTLEPSTTRTGYSTKGPTHYQDGTLATTAARPQGLTSPDSEPHPSSLTSPHSSVLLSQHLFPWLTHCTHSPNQISLPSPIAYHLRPLTTPLTPPLCQSTRSPSGPLPQAHMVPHTKLNKVLRNLQTTFDSTWVEK